MGERQRHVICCSAGECMGLCVHQLQAGCNSSGNLGLTVMTCKSSMTASAFTNKTQRQATDVLRDERHNAACDVVELEQAGTIAASRRSCPVLRSTLSAWQSTIQTVLARLWRAEPIFRCHLAAWALKATMPLLARCCWCWRAGCATVQGADDGRSASCWAEEAEHPLSGSSTVLQAARLQWQ